MSNAMRRLASRSAGLAVLASLVAAPLAHAHSLGSFAAADANHDGRITLQEFSAYETKRLMAANGFMARMFKQMSLQEQTAKLQARFDKLDSGNKGYLDRQDWTAS